MDHATRETTSSASSTRVVDVLVPVALNQNYSYRVPRGMELKPGDVVCVPLGPREVVAVVWAENANPDPRLHNRLKDVGEKLDVPPLKGELRSLVDWVANYTLSARGMVLRMTLRMGENLGPERMRLGVRQFSCRAARRRHRFRQDRSLFRGDCGNHPPRQAVADPDAGDRADRPIPRSFRAAVWRASAGMALRTDAAHPR